MDFNMCEVDAKNSFIRDFNLFIDLYKRKLNKLGLVNEENFALILNKEVYSLEEKFSQYQKDMFFSSVVGRVTVELFKDLLIMVSEDMDKAYDKQNNSVLYCFIHSFISEKWYVNYQRLCYGYKVISFEDYMDAVILKFSEIINKSNLTLDEIENLFVSLKGELIILTGNDGINFEIEKNQGKVLRR